MSYQVLARKWRPRRFEEMVGQEHVLKAIINALDNDRLHHAYLFTGTRGVGKTTIARIFSKSLNCEQGISSKPCGECSTCREIDEGRFVDLLEVDAASRTKVEDTRELLENVQYTPTRGRYKVYLIDEVHMLSNHSFNALLKTLEEPPAHVKFLLATTDPQRLPVTILSRCLQFNLKRMPLEMISQHLNYILQQENITADAGALALIAKGADGSMRDALSLLDQGIAHGGGDLREADIRAMLGTIDRDHVYVVMDALVEKDADAVLNAVQLIAEQVPDFDYVLGELLSLLHAVAVNQLVEDRKHTVDLDQARVEHYASRMSTEDVQLYYQIGLIGRRDLAYAPDLRTGFEMCLLRMLAFMPVGMELERTSAAGSVGAVNSTPGKVSKPSTPPPSNQTQSAPKVNPLNAVRSALGDALSKKTNKTDSPEPENKPPAMQTVESREVNEARPSQTLSSDASWSDMVAAMRLEGMIKQLASNCVLSLRSENRIELTLSAGFASLYNKKTEQRLQEALRTLLDKPVILEIEVGQVEADTPAVEEQRRADHRLDEARQSIENDANVRALQERFDARVIPESIRPVE